MYFTYQEFRYFNPVRICFGVDEYLHHLDEIFQTEKFKKVGLFYGSNSTVCKQVIPVIKERFGKQKFYDYGGIRSNPNVNDVQKILDQFERVDCVIAVGGGSVMDTAKTVVYCSDCQDSVASLFSVKPCEPKLKKIPVIAIPTTSGSGSEVTPWATIWDAKKKQKLSLAAFDLYVQYAIIDPSLTESLPALETAYCGFDALCHAFESYWSKNSNSISDEFAIQAINLIFNYLESCVQHPKDIHARAALAQGSLFAGLAFSNTKSSAVHAVSYPITINYNVPHGIACSLTLAEFWLFNVYSIAQEKVDRLLDILNENSPETLAQRIKNLAILVQLPVSLSELNIPEEAIDSIADYAAASNRMDNNPEPVSKSEIEKILFNIY